MCKFFRFFYKPCLTSETIFLPDPVCKLVAWIVEFLNTLTIFVGGAFKFSLSITFHFLIFSQTSFILWWLLELKKHCLWKLCQTELKKLFFALKKNVCDCLILYRKMPVTLSTYCYLIKITKFFTVLIKYFWNSIFVSLRIICC